MLENFWDTLDSMWVDLQIYLSPSKSYNVRLHRPCVIFLASSLGSLVGSQLRDLSKEVEDNQLVLEQI
jgi:hypothetical protein